MMSLPHSSLTLQEREELVTRLFAHYGSLPSLDSLEGKYPHRILPEGAKVTRFAPSPTGFAHIGAIFTSYLNRCIAHQSKGVFILRIEDTDGKREVDGATEILVKALKEFKVAPDEGPLKEGNSFSSLGSYGPYIQSQRIEIYRSVVQFLVRQGLAYPCFSTEQELSEASEIQRLQRVRPGYYGTWARWRDASFLSIMEKLEAGVPYVIRLRSWGNHEERLVWHDEIHGRMSVPSNDLDAVILKSDGGTLYHLAHAVDDHFMRVTHVIRGDEWISSVPLHLQLFEACGWAPPVYAHISPVQKIDTTEGGESRRKLSKRKDPEANVDFYKQFGYPVEAVLEYLTNLLNPQFEPWREEHPFAPLGDFALKLEHVSKSGMLIDLDKLIFVGREVISRLPLAVVMEEGTAWSRTYDRELSRIFERYPERVAAALNIEREGEKASKRIGAWNELRSQLEWFFDELFQGWDFSSLPKALTPRFAAEIIGRYLDIYEESDENSEWFSKCQDFAESLGFARSVKEFKKHPENFKGHIGDVAMTIRVALSGRSQTPDLCESLRAFGKERVRLRFNAFIEEAHHQEERPI
jgi:glutamyl-tRNA synthetase